VETLVYVIPIGVSWITSFVVGRFLLPLTSKEEKLSKPEAKGLAFTVGVMMGLFAVLGLASYSTAPIERLPLLVAVVTLLLVVILILISEHYFLLAPHLRPVAFIFAGIPLAIFRAGEVAAAASTAGLVAPLVLIPIGVSVAGGLVNQFEGYGDLVMAIIAIAALSGIAASEGEFPALVVLLAGSGAILPFSLGHRPAKVLIGDIGTFGIGALIATAAILGRFEIAACIVLIPYLVNLGFKVAARSVWELTIKKLSTSALILVFAGIEALFGLIAVLVGLAF